MADLFDKCHAYNRHSEAIAGGYYPYFKAIASLDGSYVTVDGRKMIMIGSNSYLGLGHHPKVKEAAAKAVEEYGTSCSGSRFLNGTLEIHEQLENSLATFVGKEAAQVFSTGFQTNQGVIAPLVGRNDSVIIDRLVHASVVEGARLSFGKIRRFRHNDMESLSKHLDACPKDNGKLIVVDGVYSMEGDLALLPEIVPMAKEYGARLMVDDAHGIGVLGRQGRGVLDHFEVSDDVDLVMGTFSKSFASLGGFVAGDKEVISFIKHTSRALIFSASMPPSTVAAVQTALEVMQTEPEIRERLWRNTKFLTEGLQSLGFDTGQTQTPIVPIIVGDDIRTAIFWKRLFDAGIFSNCVVAPAVPEGSQRIRASLMASHTIEDLQIVIEECELIGKDLGII
jgi:8-amino-7-oxononanoate synthase